MLSLARSRTVVRLFTDIQLQTALQIECSMVVKFGSVEDGFNASEACAWFAEWLTEARMWVLVTGSFGGFEQFCIDFYEHLEFWPILDALLVLVFGSAVFWSDRLGAVLIDVIQWL